MSLAEAWGILLRELAPLPAERVPLREAAGRVLAEDVRSPLALPPWDNASMDGYAANAGDLRGASPDRPVSLPVDGTLAAGSSAGGTLARGHAIRIMTGAPIPAGADSVVRVEDTDGGIDVVRIVSDRDANRNIRPRGEDIGAGDIAVPGSSELSAGQIGLLASVGCADLRVHRRPRVGVLASGAELVEVERFQEVIQGHRIVTSNSYSLEAAVREAGGVPVWLGVVADDAQEMARRIADGMRQCDLLVTTGGVSVGAFDFTREAVAQLGVSMRFQRVRIRPGAPVGFGFLGASAVPWFGLPGNPVSTLVTFELFARPAIRRMRGLALPFRSPVQVRLEEAVTVGAPLTHLLRAIVRRDGAGLAARLTGGQGSGVLSSMARANAIIVIPEHTTDLPAGDMVDALLLRDDVQHSVSPMRS